MSMEFDASDLYNFQNTSDFIFDDEEDAISGLSEDTR